MSPLPIVFSAQFLKDLPKLQKENSKLGFKVFELITDIVQNPKDPLSGRGQPEALKGNLAGCYSRRITQKHRLVYKIESERVMLISAYGHYEQW